MGDLGRGCSGDAGPPGLIEAGRRTSYTGGMYGYEPPRESERPGGCRDSLAILRVAFEVLLPIAVAGIGAMGFIALTVVLFTNHVLLGLIPVGLAVLAVVWLIQRDKRLQRERERDIDGMRGPPRGPAAP